MDHLNVLEKIKTSLDNKENFVVHGGAGSGKTQILKETIEYLALKDLDNNLLCITHTNVAADEIRSRVDFGKYTVLTIHSFLNKLCSGYSRNIQQLLHQYFSVDLFEEIDPNKFDDEKSYKLGRYKAYKKRHKNLSKVLYGLNEELLYSEVGKREFDKNAKSHVKYLNEKIISFNEILSRHFKTIDTTKIGYNETVFDNISQGTYGHDGLLKIASLLFGTFDKLHKILSDKYAFILIDEYQDSNEAIINILLNLKHPVLVGLFGDSMQGIYKNTIGNADYLCKSGKLKEIIKSDNYRCSVQVTKFINNLRNDGLVQKVQLKDKEKDIGDRQGKVRLYYSVYDKIRPTSRSKKEIKDEYLSVLENVISTAQSKHPNYKILLLTNRIVANKVGFPKLFSIFSKRYIDVAEKLESFFKKTNLSDLCEIVSDYYDKKYNKVISKLRKNGYNINSIEDKTRIKNIFSKLHDTEMSVWEALEYAVDKKIIVKSKYLDYFESKNEELVKNIESDFLFIEFSQNFDAGHNTFTRISKVMKIEDEMQFNKLLSKYKRKLFYKSLKDSGLNFLEVRMYYDYLNEKTNFITMHKTKGTSIENVIVVGDNYFWEEYQFNSVYNDIFEPPIDKDIISKKLFYVACSRCISNLIVIHLFDKKQGKEVTDKFDEVITI